MTIESQERRMILVTRTRYGYENAVIHKPTHRKLLDDLLSIQHQCASLILTLR